MRCPRCHGETGHAAIRCAECGAPLSLTEEPGVPRLGREVDLDRRAPRWPLAPATPEDLPATGPVLAMPASVVELHRASSLRRTAAWIVDGIPFALGGLLLARAMGGGQLGLELQLAAVAALASFTYQTLSHWLAGATLGKRLLGLGVVGPDGERPGPGRSALRAGVALIGTLLLGIGPLLALFTESGQGLHDLVARTLVVDMP